MKVSWYIAFSPRKIGKPLIPEPMKRKPWAYIGGIARTNKFKALAVGGMPDHIHVLLSLPATLLVATC
jgi:REP element-mobilizing transposase RayT